LEGILQRSLNTSSHLILKYFILLKSSLTLFLGSIAIAFSSLFMGIVTARFLGPVGRGEFYLALQIISIGALILSTGLGPAYQYHLSNGRFRKSYLLTHLLVQIFLIGLFFWIIKLNYPIVHHLTDIKYTFMILCLVGVWLNIINLFFTSTLQAQKNGILANTIISVLGSISNLFILLLFAFKFKLNFNYVILIYFVGLTFQILPKGYLLFKDIRINLNLNWLRLTKTLYRFGSASFFTNIAVLLVFRIDTFFINNLSGLDDLGKYSVAVSIAEMLLMFPSSIGTALFAHLANLEAKEKLELLTKVTRSIIVITFAIFIVMTLISKFIVINIFGLNYLESVLPLQILSLGLVGMASNYVFSNFYSGNGQPIKSAIVFGKGLILNFILNYLLIPRYGIIGAAFASSITYYIIALFFYFQIRKEYKIKFSTLFIPNKSDFIYLFGLFKTYFRFKKILLTNDITK
jgi:O-antigen/teichoic acid export membrane protein